MLDPSQIRAITLDLDDTLWPIWPAIHRAEEVLLLWLKEHAAKTAALFPTSEALRSIRLQIERERPDLRHDLSALRRESIAEAMRRAGDDERLAIPAFDIFSRSASKCSCLTTVCRHWSSWRSAGPLWR